MVKITNKHLKMISTIANNISISTGIPKEDLEAEATDKIPQIIKNYDEKTEVPFDNYFTISVRGYCLNYRRDKSFISAIPRNELNIYLNSIKYANIKQASSRMGLTEEYLENLHLKVKLNKNFVSFSIEDEWILPVKNFDVNDYVSLLQSCDFTDLEISLLEDIYLDKLSKTKLIRKYGRGYEEIAKILVDIINEKRSS